jgi:hypothetical protein
MEIKVGFLTSYDYEFLKYSLPPVYEAADRIVIAIDINRKTWAGKPFEIPVSFLAWIKEFDLKNKIIVYEDEFFIEGKQTHELETRERNLLAEKLGLGGWHFQIDGDEYFTNFEELIAELRNQEKKIAGKNVTFYAFWKTIFKITPTGYYLISGKPEPVPIVSNNPKYDHNRTNLRNEKIQLNFVLLHQSWGRTKKDLETKLKNWGHNEDFDAEKFLNFWGSIDQYNYKYFRNFHPLVPAYWEQLEFIQACSIDDLIKKIPTQLTLPNIRPVKKGFKWVPLRVYKKLSLLKRILLG